MAQPVGGCLVAHGIEDDRLATGRDGVKTMVHFFGILSPSLGRRMPANEAPHKASFFGPADPVLGTLPMSRSERDACYLAGKAPEPETMAPGSVGSDPLLAGDTF